MPKPAKTKTDDKVQVMEDSDRERYLHEIRKNWLKEKASVEQKNSKYNMSKIQESWLKIMRSAKTKQLKRDVEIIAQNHERDVDRKDAILQMLDRDIDEGEEQHQVAIRTHLQNVDSLLEIQHSRLEALDQDFGKEVSGLENDWWNERERLTWSSNAQQRELQNIIQEVANEDKAKEQADVTEHQSQYEMIRNKNIEEDHQMRSNLEEKIEGMKDQCNSALNAYRLSTETNTSDYKAFLARDANLSKHVEKKLRQVERMQSSISHWKGKIAATTAECEERNSYLRAEKENLVHHYWELKTKMNIYRGDTQKRLTDLCMNSRTCIQSLKKQLTLGEGILKLAEQCARYETEREKVIPFYQSTGLTAEDVDNLPTETLMRYVADFQTEAKAEASAQAGAIAATGKMDKLGLDPSAAAAPAEVQEDQLGDEYTNLKAEMTDVLTGEPARDEWTYLDTFFRRFNKVHLDVLAIKKERFRLKTENTQLRSILKQFLDGVAVSEDILSKPNPLMVVNGKVNLNYVPLKREEPLRKVCIEANQVHLS